MALESLKRSFGTMMSIKKKKEPFEDSIMTTDSPGQSFGSLGSSAMSIDSEDAPQDSGVDINSPPVPPPNTQSDQYNDTDTVDLHTNPNPIKTTTKTPPTTPTFTGLPPAVRTLIWFHAAPAPRTRFLELHTYNTIDHIPRIRYIPPLPPLFSTNQEARNFSIALEGGELVNFTSENFTALFSFHGRKIGGEENEKKFYFNFDRDIIWLSARFTAACNTTETLRLQTLSSILPPISLSHIQRLVISYSGLDSYALIGPYLRPFARLETLYLCTNDARIKDNVKRLLKKGVPADGVTADKLKSMIEQTEADETDDDEESEDLTTERLAVRASRRVLEVYLRLEE
ncbi:uncharacterized protein J4E84_002367 [Alternaria hordeiaustralica]|uniref:uncharacterized protein n=1 Tax=Alternaria hordeiaustralica TaxID=1187925 RepID=UPI0020C417A9|nr:uncharacterized protein J4E84_002367 [Alternaria hordeiaustralica]KAI4693791.1 hypothetical protein J4E84_002367 [Alternaria hordeiaustralica]